MDRSWLESELAKGRSIESIAREVGKDSSTVGYWVGKYGLSSQHADKHAPRGGIDRDTLESLVVRGLSSYAIAGELGCCQATVRHWLKKHGLRTERARSSETQSDEIERTCTVHGRTIFVRYGRTDHYRCLRCRKERVVARRRKVKEILVLEAGGACALCGYTRYAGALHFHHLDPTEKQFGLGMRGVARALERCRAEAAKCVLLCANCHAEVEGGVARLPLRELRQVPA
jgi:predicted transcriptional regulator